VSSADLAPAGSEREPVLHFGHWPAVRRAALAIYFAVLVVWSAHYGIPVQRELVVAWVCGALACACIGRHPREMLRLAVDWVPMVIVLAAYDLTRGAADKLGIGVHYQPMIAFDKAVFFGQTPTEWIQRHVYSPGTLSAWNVAFTLIYTSYFIIPFLLAGWLWARDRAAYLRFVKRLVSLALAGVATYILFPAAPPWLAAQEGLLHDVHRTTSEGWKIIGVGTSVLFSEGQAAVNLVAAVPSLHSAFTMLVALFLWDRVPWRWARPLLLLYPAAMGFTLMATAEHYFFDVLLGWVYAGAAMAAWAWWERRRALRTA
jgi:membrane-associated phospholipid phosphatase